MRLHHLVFVALGTVACSGGDDTDSDIPVEDNDNDTLPADTDSDSPDTDTDPDPGSLYDIVLPFSITEEGYVPEGWMGDGAVAGATALSTEECGSDRAPNNPQGACLKITYTPIVGDGAAFFAGIYWMQPNTNFGQAPTDLTVQPGATKVRFQAKADTATATFYQSGISDPNSGPYQDAWLERAPVEPATPGTALDRAIVLNTDWQQIEIDISAQTYEEISGPFAFFIPQSLETAAGANDWTEVNANDQTYVIYVDDIVVE